MIFKMWNVQKNPHGDCKVVGLTHLPKSKLFIIYDAEFFLTMIDCKQVCEHVSVCVYTLIVGVATRSLYVKKNR